jgi:hypothetical protein
MKSVR